VGEKGAGAPCLRIPAIPKLKKHWSSIKKKIHKRKKIGFVRENVQSFCLGRGLGGQKRLQAQSVLQ